MLGLIPEWKKIIDDVYDPASVQEPFQSGSFGRRLSEGERGRAEKNDKSDQEGNSFETQHPGLLFDLPQAGKRRPVLL